MTLTAASSYALVQSVGEMSTQYRRFIGKFKSIPCGPDAEKQKKKKDKKRKKMIKV